MTGVFVQFVNFFVQVQKFNLLRRKKRNKYKDISGDEIALEQEWPLVQMPITEVPHQDTEVGQVEASQVEVHVSEI